MARALICGVCGGPLPRPETGVRFVVCHFCKTTSDLETGTRQGADGQASVDVDEGLKRELDTFQAAYAERIKRGEAPLAAFRAAAELAFAGICDPESMTNVVFGIAADFEQANGVDVTLDPVVVPRLAKAYLMALQELRTQPRYEINLPFLTATKDGPLHFSQGVTIARLSELAKHAPTAKAPQKTWWKRLLG